jgi:hypothetical protein
MEDDSIDMEYIWSRWPLPLTYPAAVVTPMSAALHTT